MFVVCRGSRKRFAPDDDVLGHLSRRDACLFDRLTWGNGGVLVGVWLVNGPQGSFFNFLVLPDLTHHSGVNMNMYGIGSICHLDVHDIHRLVHRCGKKQGFHLDQDHRPQEAIEFHQVEFFGRDRSHHRAC